MGNNSKIMRIMNKRLFLMGLMATVAINYRIAKPFEVKVRVIDRITGSDETYYKFMYIKPEWLDYFSENR